MGDIIPVDDSFKDEISRLSVYAVRIRYPGLIAVHDEAEVVMATTNKLRGIIRQYFGLSIEQQAEQKIEQQESDTEQTQDVHHDRGRHR